MATLSQWVSGARLRTLPIVIAPVVIGTAAALGEAETVHWFRFVLALLVGLLLQVGVNYSNDYSDGIRGTDDERVGPLRLTGSKLTAPKNVRNAAFGCFGLAAICGLVLVVLSSAWPLLLVGVAAIFAAWGYTGGKNPYGYRGLGDIYVFIFFGLVATLGTTYTQINQLTFTSLWGAIGTGLIGCALLMANNVRDIPTDKEVGKITLAVRLGEHNARLSYVLMLALAILLPLLATGNFPWMWLILITFIPAVAPSLLMLREQKLSNLVLVLKQTGIVNMVYALLFALAIVIEVFA
ncbi:MULTISPECIES: 1,4-dihydroxy-2-naphthoate polyprenyltransferase [Glutamicibacter]|uniref:1,4-dihydroxy-2-naphthoate octaprenyltransferase n=2 Tax=Glutamicibacter arilaitensis TaxID=256701 RepID=A0A2N7S265_9MICC|nr:MULTISPECIES: 1,4-dihydroxy-2-naphthoate polyprenyltransferase [Glutamicibacter]PMQ20239.1 1,4-dihydroxy-2-naphthoate polyprenyltransferase [Glutamicibacter arilaitensis]CBT76675.1 1,4-dihydroxy-2-naphthoate octaprenyltransferase [Glutamicibacter arilaitensis Re117]HCH48129.1 1,4-dihydroxy-2-naphthoate polyprenyltransferase [Glutamicibacter sp.]HCJ55223.1 1,4-dihydroxy-2-naphthoate polyprenyltransferase [Glutamicibacter sp.]HCM93871.1 1,4-dihydroxy-2-naphthoate polyprenyltransferase [Glutam